MGLKDGAGLEQWEITVVKIIVSEFRRRLRSIGPEDVEDLQQECLLHWILVRGRIVPTGDGLPVLRCQVQRSIRVAALVDRLRGAVDASDGRHSNSLSAYATPIRRTISLLK